MRTVKYASSVNDRGSIVTIVRSSYMRWIFFTFTEATGGEAKAAAAKAPTGAASARAGTAEAAATATEAAGAAAAGARQRRRRPILPLQLGQWLIEASVISTAKERGKMKNAI